MSVSIVRYVLYVAVATQENELKKWSAKKKLELAMKWLKNSGLTPCRIIRKAGTDYIVASDGSFRRIGR